MNTLKIAYTTTQQRKQYFSEAYVLAGIWYGVLDDFTIYEMQKYIVGDKELTEVEQAIYDRYKSYGESEKSKMPLWDNCFGIYRERMLQKLNAAIATIGIMKLDSLPVTELDFEYYRFIHKLIYGKVYPWAGEIRDVESFKKVDSLQHISYTIIKPENIQMELDDLFEKIQWVIDRNNIEAALKSMFGAIGIHGWNQMDERERIENLVGSIGNLWSIHPFLHGNMLTELYFMVRACGELGISCKRGVFQEYAKNNRLEQCMILACYKPDILEKIVYRAVKENKSVQQRKYQEDRIQEKQSWVQVKKMVADRKRKEAELREERENKTSGG